MKFLLVSSYADSLLNFRGPLIKALQAAGLDVHVAAPGLQPGSSLYKEMSNMGLGIHNIPMQRTGTNPLQDLKTLWCLYRLMRRIKPDYLLSYFIKPVIYGSIAGALARIPHRFALIAGLGLTFQHHSEEDPGKQTLITGGIVPLLYRIAIHQVKTVFFQNPDDMALFHNLKITTQKNKAVVVNGSGIDIQKFSVSPLPEKNGKIQPHFLLIARLLAAKGTRIYADAARQIKQHYPEARFRLVGWIDENPDAISEQELATWQKEGIIEYLGKLDDVRPAIDDTTVFVLPSYYREGTPRTILEAMAMGRPVITTNAPGCKEAVIDGYNGFLIPVKSVDSVVSAIKRFLDDPELATIMGNHSRKFAEEKYDVNKVNAIMLEEMGIFRKTHD